MSAVIAVTGEERVPLLRNSIRSDGEEIVPSSSSEPPEEPKSIAADSNQRLVSLDVFRGLTVALMILVDDAGGAFPSINHSPWFGVTLADFVMPCFLFGVGISFSLRTTNKALTTKKVLLRSIKLYILGLFLQGGYFHGRGHLSYGVDIRKIRWLGVLQRMSIGYLLASLSEIWLVSNIVVSSPAAFVRKYYAQWITAILLCTLYMCLLYGLYVPDWEFESPDMKGSNGRSGTQIVQCGVRGSLEPPCNAAGMIDRFILGEHHLYQHPVYRRTRECSIKSPDYGPLPPNSPMWCLAPFDPEGILSSLMSAVTCFLGLHFEHLLVHYKDNMQWLFLWFMTSLIILIPGYVLEISGASGLLLSIIFYVVDVKHIRNLLRLFQWMGMNALIIYALAACDLFPAALQGLYWNSPENNLVDGTELLLQAMLHSKKWGTLVFVMLEIFFWAIVAGLLHMKSVYFKL